MHPLQEVCLDTDQQVFADCILKKPGWPFDLDVEPGLSDSDMAVEGPFVSSSLSLHELFQQQTRQILDRADLEEDQKQHILVAMSCPCCGAGAMSFTAKLRR
jgi:hypothetical protein